MECTKGINQTFTALIATTIYNKNHNGNSGKMFAPIEIVELSK